MDNLRITSFIKLPKQNIFHLPRIYFQLLFSFIYLYFFPSLKKTSIFFSAHLGAECLFSNRL